MTRDWRMGVVLELVDDEGFRTRAMSLSQTTLKQPCTLP